MAAALPPTLVPDNLDKAEWVSCRYLCGIGQSIESEPRPRTSTCRSVRGELERALNQT